MMSHTCIHSSPSLTGSSSLSFAFNDYSCYFDERFGRNPLSLSPTYRCCCCSNSIYRVPINPSLFFGLRQSTLIQWSPCRRLNLNGRTQYYSRFLGHDVHRICNYEKFYTVRERSIYGKKGAWGKRSGRRASAERNRGEHFLTANEDAEVMLSLLTEEVSEEIFGVRERNSRPFRMVQVQTIENSDVKSYTRGRTAVGSDHLDSTSQFDDRYDMFQSKVDNRGRRRERNEEENEKISGGRDLKPRNEGSSCSSYYSISSGEFESESEVELEHNETKGGSSSEHKSDRKKHVDIRQGDEIEGKLDMHSNFLSERSSKHESTAEGWHEEASCVNWDWRKDSEKKLGEVSVEPNVSRKKVVSENLRLSEFKGKGYTDTSHLNQNYYREEKLALALNTSAGVKQHHSKPDDREKMFNAASLAQEVTSQYGKAASSFTRKEDYKRKSLKVAEVSEEIDLRMTSMNGSHMKNSHDKEENYHKTGQVVNGQTSTGVKSQQVAGTSETYVLDTERTSFLDRNTESRNQKLEKTELAHQEAIVTHAQRIHKTRTSDQAVYLSSAVTTVEEARNRRDSTHGLEAESTSHLHRNTEISKQKLEKTDLAYQEAKVTDSQRIHRTGTSGQETFLSLGWKTEEEGRQQQDSTDNEVLQFESRKNTRRPTKASSFHEGMSKEESSSYKALKLNPQPIFEDIGTDDVKGRISHPIITDLADRFSSGYIKTGSSELKVQTHESSSGSQVQIYGGARSDFDKQDVLGSVHQLEKSSMQFVGEFVEKVRNEVSTSEVHKEKKTNTTELLRQSAERYKQDSQGQEVYESSHRSSKGPSDEMWRVSDPSTQVLLPKTNANESSPTSNVVRRTGRSLWNIIGDIFRIRWAASRSETLTSKSDRRSSPNQSTGSEAWFSGHDHDESNVENSKVVKMNLPSEPSSGEKVQPGSISSETPSSSNSDTGSAPKGILSSSTEGTYAKEVVGTSSGTAIVEPPSLLPAIRLGRSSAIKDTSEGGQKDASGSGVKIEMKQPVPILLTETSVTDAKDGKEKRKKFQRSDQVIKDRFDEWEEAHTLETEQRRIDEMFMREALLEASKGADLWEAPVGAVLVHDGKIIARGYNLVEQLRDSTCHAEMICIREASNILRTWRLSETTLYVTLEPCPMCAGAILQARIDTVVWGAPNKLLGADGSWIRLFPNGSGGSDLESADKASAPVHPFHPIITIRRGVLSSECADVMQQFFQLRRKKKETKTEPPTPPSCLPITNHPSKFFAKMHNAFNVIFCL